MFAIEGFSTVAQNHISRNIASNFYPKLGLLACLAAFTLVRNQRTSLNIGRKDFKNNKDVGEILSGKTLSPAEVMQLRNFNGYQPRIQRFETANSKWMGKYDTTPEVANPTTRAHSQAAQASALFYRARLKTPILIWHEDKNRALEGNGSREGQGLAMSQLLDESTEIAFQEHVKELNDKMWNGNPADQSADPWDQPLGVLQALSASNTYGNVDRTQADNAVWRAKVDSTLTAVDINRIVDDANITKQLNAIGNGVDLFVTTGDLYTQFKQQILSQSGGGYVLKDGLPELAKLGVRKEVLQKDNAYIIWDAACPANNVLGLAMDTWKFSIKPGKNLSVSKFVDLSDKTEGAKEADQAFIESEFIFSCDNPNMNVIYTAIGT